MPALYTHTTRASGTILTAAIYNGDHQNHITYGTAQYLGGWEASVGQMQISTDPGEQGTENLGSSISDEIEQLRFAIKEVKQRIDGTITYWYETPLAQDISGLPPLPPWYIDGLELSVAVSSPAYIELATGQCRSADNIMNLRVTSPRHRTVSALWVTSPTGGGIAVSWAKFVPYHVFVFKTAASTIDLGFDTVLTASNLMARASATHYRRVGTLNTATVPGTMRTMVQRGDQFIFISPGFNNTTFVGLAPTGSQSAVAFKLPATPTGLRLQANIRAWATGDARYAFSDFDAVQSFPDAGPVWNVSGVNGTPQEGFYWTGPSSDLRYSAFGAGVPVKIVVMGWKDPRK